MKPTSSIDKALSDKSESSSNYSDSDDEGEKVMPSKQNVPKEVPREVDIVVAEPQKEAATRDKTVIEKITGIFKTEQSVSSSSSESEEETHIVKPTSPIEDVVRDKSDSSSSSSDSDDERDNVVPSKKPLHEEVPKEIDVKRKDVIVVEESAKEPTDPDKGGLEKITGIFKSDRSISSSSSASEEDIPIVKPTSSIDKVLGDKS